MLSPYRLPDPPQSYFAGPASPPPGEVFGDRGWANDEAWHALVASGLIPDAAFFSPAAAAPEAPRPAGRGADRAPAGLLQGIPAHSEDDLCGQCGEQLRRGASDLESTCGGCGLVVERDSAGPLEDEAFRSAPITARLRIVGPNSGPLQPDLYRSGVAGTAAAQQRQIYEEYCVYRRDYIAGGGVASFPLDVCTRATEYYNAIQQQHYVKRSQNKKQIMAACLYQACLAFDFAPSKAEVATFMQLPNKGIARGNNFIRELVADGKLDVNINEDPCRPEISTLFAHIALDGAEYAGLRAAVFEVVQTAIRNNIGTSSILRSKVAGATFAVLSRCTDRSLLPRPPTLSDFCKGHLRKNTIDKCLRFLDTYHSFFEDCYRRAGLDPSPPGARRAAGPSPSPESRRGGAKAAPAKRAARA